MAKEALSGKIGMGPARTVDVLLNGSIQMLSQDSMQYPNMSAKLTITSTITLPSGFKIPSLGLGVYQNDECKPACLAALKVGYRHIDSAKMYRNEKSVGEAIRESGVEREDIFITSKIATMHGHSYQNALATVDESLANFGFDYIDLYLIHDPRSGSKSRLEAYRGLLEAKKQGKVRSVGVSNFSVKHLEELKDSGLEQPEINQIELHPFCQQKPIVEYCLKHGIIIEAYCPLVRGKFDEPILQDIAKKHSKDVAQVLVRWSLQKGYIPLPKSSQPTRIKSNADVYDFILSNQDMEAIDSLDIGDAGAVSWNPVNVS